MTGGTGMNRLYNVFCYDYLYPNPKSVMAFIENHDTDRFLGAGGAPPGGRRGQG